MRTVALAVAAGLALTACGGDDPAGRASEPTTTAAERDEPGGSTTTATTAAPVEDDHEGFTDLELVAPELLIRAAELGVEGAEELGYTPPEAASGCPTDLDAEHAPELHVGTTVAAGGVTVVESLRVFADADAAGAAYDDWTGADPACRPSDPAASAPADVNEHVGADASVSFAAPAGDDVLVIALLGDALVSVRTTGTATAADGSRVLPPLDVAAFAVGKLLAALEA